MSENKVNEIKPYLSLIVISISLFVAVFLKMEVRRVGYSVLKLSNEVREIQSENKIVKMKLAHMTRPSYIHQVAKTQLTLQKGTSAQFIHIASLYPSRWQQKE